MAIEFNDVDALERALATGEIAVVLAEPAMTNMGIILPDDGYIDALRELTRRHGTLLIIDETHTFSAGPGGCTRRGALEPDILVIGKAIAGGVPAGAMGITEELVERLFADERGRLRGHGRRRRHARRQRALQRGDARDARAHAPRRGVRPHDPARDTLRAGGPERDRRARAAVERQPARLPRRIPVPPRPARNGTVADAAHDEDLEHYLHLHALNRGVMITPFHNMALMCPQSTEADVDRHTEVFAEAAADLAP